MPKYPASQPTGAQGEAGNPNIIGENAIDVTDTLWPTVPHMNPDGASHDGSPATNAFENQGSDANHGTTKRETLVPPWLG